MLPIKKKIVTVVYIHDDENILLGLKKRGFAEGKWNGFGGKLQPNESIVECAIREVQEECGLILRPEDVILSGIIDHEFKDDPVHLEVHVFQATKYSGEIIESEEMRPKWFKIKEMPYDKMWPGNKFWHPLMFRGQKFKCKVLYEGKDNLLSHEVIPVETLN